MALFVDRSVNAEDPPILWKRVVVGLVIGGVLIVAGVLAIALADQEAIQLAEKAAANPAFKPPTLGIPAVGTTLITLGSAWSTAVIALLYGEKSK